MNTPHHAASLRSIAAIIALAAASLSTGTHAAAVEATPASAGDKSITVGQYQLHTNLWGIAGAGTAWYEYLFTNSTTSIAGSGYKWSGFGGDTTTVKSYPSIRRGASNPGNDAGASGLPYQFAGNTKNVDVLWNFTPTGYDGTGAISGTFNHAIDVFFSTGTVKNMANVRAEIMVIPDSSANSQTQGWGTKDANAFVIDGETWDVWQATMTSNGNSWPVMQFRKRVKANYVSKNLKHFFAEALARRPDVFLGTYYVLMVEAGTEVKSGSGKVYNKDFVVNVY
ncbi:hypothetical protein IP91_00878 [Pseudoduganella lurida]|uniref:Uncharacterized protein n=1 Tax=Pseudoduganella lurida TaxID=1036180 RepID=A0A562RL84_9BURK|nr:hypothetical protein [Pseudoduganella lurida]TWI69805.1 hypothetical protein IP91_00878 [Pseudoduganella lurida]